MFFVGPLKYANFHSEYYPSCVTSCNEFTRLLFSPSQQLFGLVTQRHLFPDGERARSVMRPNNSCERDHAYCRSSAREKIKIIRPQLDA